MKYLSDSRRHWRENIDEVLEDGIYERLHILTHPFWYFKKEKSLKQTLSEALLAKALNCWDDLDKNFRDLRSELDRDEIERIIGI